MTAHSFTVRREIRHDSDIRRRDVTDGAEWTEALVRTAVIPPARVPVN